VRNLPANSRSTTNLATVSSTPHYSSRRISIPIANGDLPQKITVEAKGELLERKRTAALARIA
jgi:hypothetical protein